MRCSNKLYFVTPAAPVVMRKSHRSAVWSRLGSSLLRCCATSDGNFLKHRLRAQFRSGCNS
jgi:hypothetical protein